MAAVELSLDEIIALQKKQKNGGGNRRGNGMRRSGGGGPGRQNNQNNRRPQRRFVDHDAAKGALISGGNSNKVVRVNITNLAPSVVSLDLEQLFGKYNVETATVYYDELGQSCGTGDVYLRKRDAQRAIKDFTGVALDGNIMKMFLVDGTQDLGSRLDFTNRSRGVQKRDGFGGNGGNRRRGGGNRPRGGNTGGRRTGEGKQKKTEAELDAELDAYMNKPKN